jgi:hypothetical protein
MHIAVLLPTAALLLPVLSKYLATCWAPPSSSRSIAALSDSEMYFGDSVEGVWDMTSASVGSMPAQVYTLAFGETHAHQTLNNEATDGEQYFVGRGFCALSATVEVNGEAWEGRVRFTENWPQVFNDSYLI